MDYTISCSPCLLKFLPKKLECGNSTTLYCFDLDYTLIKTKSGSLHSKNHNDWDWLPNQSEADGEHKNMFFLLTQLLKQNTSSKLVIFTNQGGLKPFNKGYLKNNGAKAEKAQAHHIELRFKQFIFKVNQILKYFHDVLKEDRVLVYGSIKTPMGLSTRKNPQATQKSKLQLNKIMKPKKITSEAAQLTEEFVIKNIQVDYYHDIPHHSLVIDSPSKTVVHFQNFDKLDKEKLESQLNCLDYRKPQLGMLKELYKDLGPEISKDHIKFYAGDAAGRQNDFSDSDKVFAERANIAFKTPEEIFCEYKI